MCRIVHDILEAEPADHIAGAVELRVRRIFRTGAWKSIWKSNARQFFPGCPYIRSGRGNAVELPLEANGPRIKPCIAKASVYSRKVQRRNLMAGSHCCQIFFVTVYIKKSIGWNLFGVPAGENILSRSGIRSRQLVRRDLKAIVELRAFCRIQVRIDDKRRRSGQKIVLPDIW